jgi:hypothetical protein
LSSNDDTLGRKDSQTAQETHEHHQTDRHGITSLSSSKVPSADYGLFGINQTLGHDPNQARMVSRETGLQDSSTAASLPQNATFDIDFANFSNVMQAPQISSQNNGSRYADMLDPFSGYDIPFWFEQDQYWDIFQNFDG